MVVLPVPLTPTDKTTAGRSGFAGRRLASDFRQSMVGAAECVHRFIEDDCHDFRGRHGGGCCANTR